MADTVYANVPPSRMGRRAGSLMAALAVLFLLADAVAKLLRSPETAVLAIGVVELACIVAYLVPTTSVFGAILLTGYLGGAVATHVRMGSPLLTHTLFPVYLALLIWGGLILREQRLSGLIPLRR